MQIRWAYLKRVLAGAIFGLYMAHLLYFLNPQVDITPLRLATVTIVYGVICGFFFGSVLWGLRALRVRLLGRPDPYRSHGFGFVVFAALVSSVIYWIHLMAVRIYLPVGAVRILSKATNVITVTAFLLLALWVLQRNAERRVERAIFVVGVLLIAISSFSLYQRRESYRTERKDVVVATIGEIAGHRPVVLVAIRNLPYDWIVTLKGEGVVPFLERASEEAFFTRLEPFPTTSYQSLWASLITGKLPYRHGVTGRLSYRTPVNRDEAFLLLPNGVGFRAWGLIPPVERIPATMPSRKALPLWSMFQRLELSVRVPAWPSLATPPLSPPSPDVVRKFDPAGAAKPRIVATLARDLGALRSIGASETALTAVALEGFSAAQRVLHVFSNEIPPRGTLKGDIMRAYLQQLDAALGHVAREHPDHLLVICSPTAIAPPELPATAYSLVSELLASDDPGADDGFLLMSGPTAVHLENPAAARVVDVVPTVLFAAGLPVGRDMDGRVLTAAFSDEMLRGTRLSAIQTYEAERMIFRRSGAPQ